MSALLTTSLVLMGGGGLGFAAFFRAHMKVLNGLRKEAMTLLDRAAVEGCTITELVDLLMKFEPVTGKAEFALMMVILKHSDNVQVESKRLSAQHHMIQHQINEFRKYGAPPRSNLVKE